MEVDLRRFDPGGCSNSAGGGRATEFDLSNVRVCQEVGKLGHPVCQHVLRRALWRVRPNDS